MWPKPHRQYAHRRSPSRDSPSATLYASLSMNTLSRPHSHGGDIHGNTVRMERSIHDKERCPECGLWKAKGTVECPLRPCQHCATRPNRAQARLAMHREVMREDLRSERTAPGGPDFSRRGGLDRRLADAMRLDALLLDVQQDTSSRESAREHVRQVEARFGERAEHGNFLDHAEHGNFLNHAAKESGRSRATTSLSAVEAVETGPPLPPQASPPTLAPRTSSGSMATSTTTTTTRRAASASTASRPRASRPTPSRPTPSRPQSRTPLVDASLDRLYSTHRLPSHGARSLTTLSPALLTEVSTSHRVSLGQVLDPLVPRGSSHDQATTRRPSSR